ncbi:MAG: PEP-CTERM sorting domain-containing protein [Phycisphaerae bacterium]|nr:PEP-CTERM sorting domain-containing protein [Phycisphaerae bacterium]
MAGMGKIGVVGLVTWAWVANMAPAGVILVPNGSFELPQLAVAPPYAGSTIEVWQKAPVPAWWAGAGYSSDQWRDAGGIFVNVDPTYNTPIDNVDGNQVGFMFSPPGYELFQELTDTFEAGQSYQLIVAIQGGGYGMQLDVPMAIGLYYVDDTGARVTIGSTLAPNTNATADQTHLTDYQLDLPVVRASDAWAGKSIGIQLYSAATFANTGGFWVFDNVRLTSAVPEPAAAILFAAATLGVATRRRKK